MNYLYHMVPQEMQGSILLPLEELRKKYPQSYAKSMKKYKGREHQPKEKIPLFNCKWEEVLNFTTVDPKELKRYLIESGGIPRTIKWYKIPTSMLNHEKLIVFLYRSDLLENGMHNNLENFKKFKEQDLEKYNKIPEKTKTYFKKRYKEKKKPLLFHLIPHILYKGELDISKCEVITI
ncbi:hypothetical protein FJZ18_02210 [Candidatus Pacearchaeota archaeon]|nr:hypothetical protein [Candidatus Pacearchaeota archaeon]